MVILDLVVVVQSVLLREFTKVIMAKHVILRASFLESRREGEVRLCSHAAFGGSSSREPSLSKPQMSTANGMSRELTSFCLGVGYMLVILAGNRLVWDPAAKHIQFCRHVAELQSTFSKCRG